MPPIIREEIPRKALPGTLERFSNLAIYFNDMRFWIGHEDRNESIQELFSAKVCEDRLLCRRRDLTSEHVVGQPSCSNAPAARFPRGQPLNLASHILEFISGLQAKAGFIGK